MTTKFISALREAYVKTLIEHGKLYHFDDNAEEQIQLETGKPAFTPQESHIVNAISHFLYDEELFVIALREDKDKL